METYRRQGDSRIMFITGGKENKDSWKKEIARILKEHKKIDDNTVGRLALVINSGGVRDALWIEKKIE